ncbi:MAG: RlmE family RNA methyltransferase [Burkholderiaceae bacterium]
MGIKKSRNKSKGEWLHRHVNDQFVQKAQQEGYRSRAAYKLIEILEAEQLGKSTLLRVVDLGSAPGAWSQVLAKRLSARARIVALDLLPMEPVEGVRFIQGDFREAEALQALEAELGDRSLDLVVSDMAPNLSGVAVADSARMSDLAELALDLARQRLTPDGVLVIKCFHGSGFSQIVRDFKLVFRQVRERKPQASRAESAETFLIGRGLKADAGSAD